jgi:hypothetical protein
VAGLPKVRIIYNCEVRTDLLASRAHLAAGCGSRKSLYELPEFFSWAHLLFLASHGFFAQEIVELLAKCPFASSCDGGIVV